MMKYSLLFCYLISFVLLEIKLLFFKIDLFVEANEHDHSINKRAIYYNRKKNWTSPINFYVSKNLEKYKNKIKTILNNFEKLTCLNFSERNEPIVNMSGVTFELDKTKCYSQVGKHPGTKNQFVYLHRECVKYAGIIVHEFSHALGLNHEHSRPDRDNFVVINEDNVLKEKGVNISLFKKDNNSSFIIYPDIPYDYNSIMHYKRDAYVKKSGLNSIEAKNIKLYNLMMGQREKLSFNDIKTINYYYCSDACKESEVVCKNGGYRNWDQRRCNQCICPKGYYGYTCKYIKPLGTNCSDYKLIAENYTKELTEE
uniref:Metalloendopeptidase n=1 Tax=Parastrongyloides trichosuri TaxID=131310 RepID=A0A0N4Z7Q2_PARTI